MNIYSSYAPYGAYGYQGGYNNYKAYNNYNNYSYGGGNNQGFQADAFNMMQMMLQAMMNLFQYKQPDKGVQPPPPPPPVTGPLAGLTNNFKQYDLNQDGVLQNSELKQAEGQLPNEAGNITGLRANFDELIFASIDVGPQAWHGLTHRDLTRINQKLGEGITLNTQADQLRNKIAYERGVSNDPEQFRNWVHDNQLYFAS